VNKFKPPAWICALPLALAASAIQAQSSCSSDGQQPPAGLMERFVEADCESCWSDPKALQPGRGELALDWIVPSSRGEDAWLSNGATTEARERLKALRRPAPVQADAIRRKAESGPQELRVAHGQVFNGYIGASIELQPGNGGPWQAWLLLVETLAGGTEGTGVERNLVRSVLQLTWPPSAASAGPSPRFFESRPMSVPAGAHPDRLRVVGWIEDTRGTIRGIAQSRCEN